MTDQSTGVAQVELVDPGDLLLIVADTLDDLEDVRKALANRHRALTTIETVGEKGGSFGKGIPADHPTAARLAGLLDAIEGLEHEAELELKRTLRTHHLHDWVKRTVGVGEKQAARLLAAIGDPAERRTVSQLWAYCGYHVLHPSHLSVDTQTPSAGVDPSGPDQCAGDTHSPHVGASPSSDTGHHDTDTHEVGAGVAPTRARGQKANWNTTAKSRVWLVAASCIKQAHSPYRAIYDAARTKYADAVHTVDCKRCGPSGKPALVGSDLSDGHKHARAMRIVSKAILHDLWIESRRAIVAAEPNRASLGALDARQTRTPETPSDPTSGGLDSPPTDHDQFDAQARDVGGGQPREAAA